MQDSNQGPYHTDNGSSNPSKIIINEQEIVVQPGNKSVKSRGIWSVIFRV